MMPDRCVIIIGAGAAGLMAGCAAAECGARVLILEKNEKAGKKIYITGKGRCNFTNACETEDFFANVPHNASFLYSSIYAFPPSEVIGWFEARGMKTKVERGNRAFPQSDHASDVTAALTRELKRLGAQIRFGAEVKEVLFESMSAKEAESDADSAVSDKQGLSEYIATSATTAELDEIHKKKKQGTDRKTVGVRCADGTVYHADAVIVATGGLSYESTGSTGDGYAFAKTAGHKVSALTPSLVPMNCAEEDVKSLQGLSLKNVTFRIKNKKKVIFSGFGELMFTHFGITGPLVLSASADIQDAVRKGAPLHGEIDLKSALDEEKFDQRLLREFAANPNRHIGNVLGAVYPAKLVPVMLKRSGIDASLPVHEITKEMRHALVQETKHFHLTVTSLRSFKEAVITHGGVDVRGVDPSTMESKLAKGLYFAGEVLDVDAYTGGFNLQIAWATGRAAGRAAGGGTA